VPCPVRFDAGETFGFLFWWRLGIVIQKDRIEVERIDAERGQTRILLQRTVSHHAEGKVGFAAPGQDVSFGAD